MKTKETLLNLLEENKGVFLSGEEIAGRLKVSRTAVWKNIKTLKNEGYPIDAITNKGYCLSSVTDVLSDTNIEKLLNKNCEDMTISVIPVVTSTNYVVREKAISGEKEGFVLVSAEQTSGRGRLGRNFFSPPGTGIYLSILLRPSECPASEAVKITTIAAVAMCQAIENVTCKSPSIKWVNDIFIGDKKVCGILTDASVNLENGLLDYAILGIGLNIYPPKDGFPDDLKNIAGSIFSSTQDNIKNRLTSEFLNQFMNYYGNLDSNEYVEKYRQKSLVIGKEVDVISANGTKKALVLGIDNKCRLQLKYSNGETASLSSGEISIKI